MSEWVGGWGKFEIEFNRHAKEVGQVYEFCYIKGIDTNQVVAVLSLMTSS